MDILTLTIIILVAIISWIVHQENKKKQKLEREKIEQIYENLSLYEKKLFSNINLKEWTKSINNYYFEKIKNNELFEGLAIEMYSFYKSRDDISFILFFDREKDLWRSESIIKRKEVGSLNFYLAEGNSLQACINTSNYQIDKVDFLKQKELVNKRDAIIDEMERLIAIYVNDSEFDIEVHPHEYMMEQIVKIDNKIKYMHLNDAQIRKSEIINDFKKYLGI